MVKIFAKRNDSDGLQCRKITFVFPAQACVRVIYSREVSPVPIRIGSTGIYNAKAAARRRKEFFPTWCLEVYSSVDSLKFGFSSLVCGWPRCVLFWRFPFPYAPANRERGTGNQLPGTNSLNDRRQAAAKYKNHRNAR